jgi:transcription elongation factor Elf1
MEENLIVDCPHCGEENEVVVTHFDDGVEVKENVSCLECRGAITDTAIDMDNRVVIFE